MSDDTCGMCGPDNPHRDAFDCIERLHAELAKVTAERDEAKALSYSIAHQPVGLFTAISRAEAAEKERDSVKQELTHALNSEHQLNGYLTKAHGRANAAESRLAEVEAQAAAMRLVLEKIPHRVHEGPFVITDIARDALSTDAGRALLTEVQALRRVRDAGEGCRHLLDGPLLAIRELMSALDAAKVGK